MVQKTRDNYTRLNRNCQGVVKVKKYRTRVACPGLWCENGSQSVVGCRLPPAVNFVSYLLELHLRRIGRFLGCHQASEVLQKQVNAETEGGERETDCYGAGFHDAFHPSWLGTLSKKTRENCTPFG